MSYSSYRTGVSSLGLRSKGVGTFRMASGGLPKLQSTGRASSKSLLSATSSKGLDSLQSLVSKYLTPDVSDVSAISGKVSSGMTQEYVAALEAQAKEDAQAGTYGKDGKASELRASQMAKYISPDRDTAIAQASKLLTSGSLSSTGTSTVRLSGTSYTVRISKGLSGMSAELYDENGEKFASYDSKSGGWKSVTTKAESQFQTASSSVYDEAYRAEAARLGGGTSSGTSSGLNTRA